jgi:hypothetical protein
MLVETEYALFRAVERKVYQPFLLKLFASIDEFLVTVQTVLQRRKARAGKSLEQGIRILVLMWHNMTFHNNIKMKCSVAKLGLFV